MRKADAFAGLILRPRAPEQIEYPLMIPGVDPTAIVAHLDDDAAIFGAAGNPDLTRHARLQIFQRIFDQVRQNLFDRDAVVDNRGEGLDGERGAGFLDTVMQAVADPAGDRGEIEGFGASVRRPCRDNCRIALISRSIFCVELRMKPIASGRSSSIARRVPLSGAAQPSASLRSI